MLNGNYRIEKGEAHIWVVPLAQERGNVEKYKNLLSSDEKNRACRFVFEVDRERYILAHGIMRKILGAYLGIKPEKLKFCAGKYGKPRLLNQHSGADVRFNVSYSGNLALLGITPGCEIGVDVERVREIPELKQIVKRYFTLNEINNFECKPKEEGKEIFFQYWTRKEACFKATGYGLLLPLKNLDVSRINNRAVKISTKTNDGKISEKWFLRDLKVVRKYKASVAVEKKPITMSVLFMQNTVKNR